MEDIKFVINYDYPNSSEDYVHRIGRTARSTNKGTAYTFFTPGNLKQARELVKVLEEANQTINPKLMQLVDHGRGGGGGGRSRYRSIPTNNNPNMMYQEECNRRMHGKDGGRRDGRNNNRDGAISNNPTGRDQNRPNYSYGGQVSNFQPNQYSYGQGGFTGVANNYGTAAYAQAPQPLMSQQFAPPSSSGLLNYMNQAASYQYPPPPPPPPPPTRK